MTMAREKSDLLWLLEQIEKDLGEHHNPASNIMNIISHIQTEVAELRKYKIFHDHVKAHLKPNEKVICKICGMDVEETLAEFKKTNKKVLE